MLTKDNPPVCFADSPLYTKGPLLHEEIRADCFFVEFMILYSIKKGGNTMGKRYDRYVTSQNTPRFKERRLLFLAAVGIFALNLILTGIINSHCNKHRLVKMKV